MPIIDRINVSLANIGVKTVSVIEDYDTADVCVMGRVNRRRATVKVPTGFLSADDEDKAVDAAIADVKQQLSSGMGEWPEGVTE